MFEDSRHYIIYIQTENGFGFFLCALFKAEQAGPIFDDEGQIALSHERRTRERERESEACLPAFFF